MGEVPSVRMVLPMDMKNLASLSNEVVYVSVPIRDAYPKVAAEPAMY
jgi:hypothetical protein